ncbi:MAG: SPOR domain-containing protein [Alphaproteobacteria bacterium]
MTADPLSSDVGGAPDGRRPSSRRGLKIATALVGLAALAVLAGYGYERLTSPGDDGPRDVRLVRAENTPTKKRPDEPGGMTIPNLDKLVYESLSEDGGEEKVERLLPPPEEPLPPPAAPEPAATAPSEPAAAPQPEPEPQPAETVPATATVPTPAPLPAAKQPAIAAVTPETVPAPAATESRRYLVQLAAFRKRPAADVAWKRLLKENRDLLGGLEPRVLRADLGAEKGVFYRLRAGPFAGAKEAKALCAKLKARSLDCLVIKP